MSKSISLKSSWYLDLLGPFRTATLSNKSPDGRFGYPGDVIIPAVSLISILLHEALNPDLVISYFCTKLEAFIKAVLSVTIGVTDWIVHYEFQSRGSIHGHCMLRTINGLSSIELEAALDGIVPCPDKEGKIRAMRNTILEMIWIQTWVTTNY